MDPYFYPVILSALLGGAACGLLSVYVVGMRIPFVGVFMSHAAMAGAVLGSLISAPPLPCGLALSVLATGSIGMLGGHRTRLQANISMSVLFSLMMGLTFLGIGLAPNARAPMLSLLWGSILFVSTEDAALVSSVAVLLGLFVLVLGKELRAMLFSRTLAAAAGMYEQLVWILLLAVAAVTITVNLNLMGGLMLFSLLVCPAASAFQLCRGYWTLVALSTALGAASGLGGFFVSYWLGVPTGACICIVACAGFGTATLFRRMSQRQH